MKCVHCGKEGGYVRTETIEGKKTGKKEVYCRLCGKTSEYKNGVKNGKG